MTRLSGRGDQYDIWRSDDALRGRDALCLADERSTAKPEELPFERCELFDELSTGSASHPLRRFSLWRFSEYRP